MRSQARLLTSATLLCALAVTVASVMWFSPPATGLAAVYTVNTTGDDNDGACEMLPGDCTLREAIVAANMVTMAQIRFDIGGCPPACTIAVPGAQLPIVTATGTTIDGTTEPEYGGEPLVIVDGTGSSESVGMILLADDSSVSGLVIRNFATGINAVGGSPFSGRSVIGNVVENATNDGIDHTGENTTIQDNIVTSAGRYGISGAYGNNEGLTLDGNTVIGSGETAILESPGEMTVSGNTIRESGNTALSVQGSGGPGLLTIAGNVIEDSQNSGIYVATAGSVALSDNVVTGSLADGVVVRTALMAVLDGNVVTGNAGAGVVVYEEASGTSMMANQIFGNGGLGIELLPLGVNVNDAGDGDIGTNRGQNFPELTAAVAGSLTISGTLDSRPERDYQIDFYASDECDPSGFGEGAEHVGTLPVHTGVDGIAQIEAETNADVGPGKVITATATNLGSGDTSEFSECITVTEEGGTPTPTPGPTETPGPTQTPGPTATLGPSQTPGVEARQGDVDCDEDVDSVDALKQLRHVASLPVQQQPGCPEIGSGSARVAGAGQPPALFGDVDCDGDVDSVDALKVLRHVASLPVQQTEPCTDIGI